MAEHAVVFFTGGQPPTSSMAPSSPPVSTTADFIDVDSFDLGTPSSTPTLSRSLSGRNKPRGRKAWVYKYMRDDVDTQHVFFNKAGKPEWRCRFCMQNYDIAGGTHNAKQHLNREHDIFETSSLGKRARNIQIDIAHSMLTAAKTSQKRRRLNNTEDSLLPLNGDIVERLYVNFIATCSEPLRLVECYEFRAFLQYLNSDIDIWLPKSHTTVAVWVQRQYQAAKKQKMQRVQSGRSKIHISSDIWTSPNSRAIMVVIAHFVSEDNVLETLVMDLVELEGNHKGQNMACHLLKVLEEWGIISKLGFVVMDNASNNDTMVKQLSSGMSGFV